MLHTAFSDAKLSSHFLEVHRKAHLLLPLTRTVLPFDAHDFLLNLICNVSFCLLFY